MNLIDLYHMLPLWVREAGKISRKKAKGIDIHIDRADMIDMLLECDMWEDWEINDMSDEYMHMLCIYMAAKVR